MVQHRRHRIGHVDDATGVAADHKQESVGRLQDQMFQLLIGEKRRLVGTVGASVAGAAQRFHVGDGHAQDGQLVGLAGERIAGGHHVGQFRDVGGHLVASPALDFAVILAAV